MSGNVAVAQCLRVAAAMCLGLLLPPSLSRAQSMEANRCSNRLTPAQIETRLHQLIAQLTVPERIAQLQDRAPAVPRLGLPAYNWWNEGLHGLARNGYATVFPQAIGLAATWDPELLRQAGEVVGTETRAKFNAHGRDNTPRYGGLTLWSPNINIFRDPRWGRGQETYGEDPLLTSTLGTAFVKGIQGEDPFYLRADATPKHFAAHSGPEKGRDSFNAGVSPHDLEDTYLRAFHSLTVEGHAAALMCSYNEINGVPSCAREGTLKETLRERWGFRGYVVSDCDAVGDVSNYHHFAEDEIHGAALALKAGTDLDCGTTYAALQQGYQQGLVTEAELDQALLRLLQARVRLGLLDPPGCTPYDGLAGKDVDTEADRQLARKAAEESLVLLRNDGALPLPREARLAVVGPTADMLKVLEANYHGTAKEPVTPLEGLQAIFKHVGYAQGSLLADGVAAPVPRSAFHRRADSGAPLGLRAEFFSKPDFDGPPQAEATVPKVDLDLDRVGPIPAISSNQYAVRWSGYLVPPAPGTYTLRVNVERCWDCTAHDAFRLFLDDRLVLDNHGAKADSDHVLVSMQDTAPHALRLELLHTGEDEGIALEWLPPADTLLQAAKQEAMKADAVVAFLGLSPDLEGEALQLVLPGFDGGDRTSLALPASQQALLEAMLAVGKPVVLVLTSGSAVTLGPHTRGPAAVLEAWYPGEQGGRAVAEVLAGIVNPSGRLPVTFYRSVDDLPSFSDYSMARRTYRYFNGPVLYPFGYGLSYSRFIYGSPTLSTQAVQAGQPLAVKIRVRNTSPLAGDEVVQMYLQPPHTLGNPRLELVGFQRIRLDAGQSKEVSFPLEALQISTVDEAGRRAVRSGSYRVFVGGHQPDLNTEKGAFFTVSGSVGLPF